MNRIVATVIWYAIVVSCVLYAVLALHPEKKNKPFKFSEPVWTVLMPTQEQKKSMLDLEKRGFNPRRFEKHGDEIWLGWERK